MPPVPRVPDALRHGPFDHRDAERHGVSERMLRGRQWKRLHPRVWVHRDHEMTRLDTIAAAALTLPRRAHVSHESRLQLLGLDVGDTVPVRFTIAGDHHVATEGIFLHRTVALPPLDAHGVTPAAAFIQYCSSARLIDAIVAGDWLLHREHTTRSEVLEVARHQEWRPGASQAVEVLRWLDARSRSPKESELRAVLVASGLPAPEVNTAIHRGREQIAVVDLLYEFWRLVVEYEGRQHALETRQFQIDITRYARLREASFEYVQVTQAMLAQPRALVLHVHQALVRRGYGGPPPDLGTAWSALWEPIAVPPRLRAVS